MPPAAVICSGDGESRRPRRERGCASARKRRSASLQRRPDRAAIAPNHATALPTPESLLWACALGRLRIAQGSLPSELERN